MKRWISLLCAALMTACSPPQNHLQGYVEGEYVYISSPRTGALQKLFVTRGDVVDAGVPLFSLEAGAELAAFEEATRRLTQSRATLQDLQKGKRPEEISALEAQLQQAKSSLGLSEIEFNRQQELFKSRANSTRDLDVSRTSLEMDRQRVTEVQAQLEIAKLGARHDQIASAEAAVNAQEAALSGAKWNLDQKKQPAPAAGLVFDTLYREGELVQAGRPIVVLLPPGNVKVRAFVPEPRLAGLKTGGSATIRLDGAPKPLMGRIAFISPSAEFTPPVIYSRETRAKLVYMVEIRFDPAISATLHPGQPVEVEFP